MIAAEEVIQIGVTRREIETMVGYVRALASHPELTEIHGVPPSLLAMAARLDKGGAAHQAFRVFVRSSSGRTVDVGPAHEWEARRRELATAAVTGLCARLSPLDKKPEGADDGAWTDFHATALASEADAIVTAMLKRELQRAADLVGAGVEEPDT